MENEVMKAARPLFDYLLGFRYRLEIGENVDIHTLRGDIHNLFGAMESHLHTMPTMQTKVSLIKYILTGFVDEVVLTSTWHHAREWQENLLEMEYFKTSVVGERFFDFLERDGYRDPDLAELFYTCLALGFQGRYRSREAELRTIKQRVYAVIPKRLPDDERRLTPGAEYVIAGQEKRLPKAFGIWVLASVLLVSALMYTVTSQWMWSDIAEVIHELSNSL